MTAANCQQAAKVRLQAVAWITADSVPGMTTAQLDALATYRAALTAIFNSTGSPQAADDPAAMTWPVTPGFLRGIA